MKLGDRVEILRDDSSTVYREFAGERGIIIRNYDAEVVVLLDKNMEQLVFGNGFTEKLKVLSELEVLVEEANQGRLAVAELLHAHKGMVEYSYPAALDKWYPLELQDGMQFRIAAPEYQYKLVGDLIARIKNKHLKIGCVEIGDLKATKHLATGLYELLSGTAWGWDCPNGNYSLRATKTHVLDLQNQREFNWIVVEHFYKSLKVYLDNREKK